MFKSLKGLVAVGGICLLLGTHIDSDGLNRLCGENVTSSMFDRYANHTHNWLQEESH